MIIKYLKDISKLDTAVAGGKGSSLGEMTRAGIPVPPGFVIPTTAYDEFLKETDLNVEIEAVFDKVNIKEIHTIENAAEKIQAMIMAKEIPPKIKTIILKHFHKLGSKFVAVRSSATSEDSSSAAWAGQLESYLNTTEQTLFENVKKCWASLFTPRAIFYKFEQKLTQNNISVAVLVQKMVQAQKSGVAFSVHPITQDTDQILIEAGFGLGEAIVSGTITPDSYVIDKRKLKIIDINVNKQIKALYKKAKGGNEWIELGEKGKRQVLREKEIVELSKLIVKIENHYGFPCDIEWVQEKDKFYIVQSRPITTLKNISKPQSKKLHYYFSWGERHSVISTESWLRGYVTLQDVIANDNRNVFILVKNGSVQTYNTEEDLTIAHKTGEKILNHRFLNTHLKSTYAVRQQYKNLFRQIKGRELRNLKDKELLRLFTKYQNLYDKTWAYFKVSQPEYLEPAHDKLKSLLKKNFDDVEEKFITLTTPIDIDLIKEEELSSYKLSLKDDISENDLLKHAENYPWLFWNTYDRKIILDFLKKKFEDLRSIGKSERIKHIKHIKEDVKKHNIEHKKIIQSAKKNRDETQYLSSVFGKLAVDRLKLKSWWGGAEYLFLPLFDEIAYRANSNTEELLMTYRIVEIESLLKEGIEINEKLRKARKKLYAVALEDGRLIFYEADEAKKRFSKNVRPEEKNNVHETGIHGVSANLGTATGKAYIVSVEDLKQLIKDMASFKEGDILVTTMTQPTMVSLARKASAIVTNEGGITSHASILAREFEIPCIVGTHTATEKIKTGDLIEVDANNGVVKILKKS